ncbi:MAG: hypothetical protein QM811_02495 [Pirellulales bacterium]
MMDELPVIPIYFDATNSMSKPYARGVYSNYHDIHPLKAITVDLDAKARHAHGERVEAAP